MSIITDALTQINNLGLDKIRCYLTGAPYATIDSEEIRIALDAELENEPGLAVDRLVDIWQLRALSFNSQVLPSLRGVNIKALLPLMRAGHNGQVKVMTYMLTRLLFPHIGSEPLSSEVARDRMLFATHLYDTAVAWDFMKVADYVQKLAAIDSYCSMAYWHKLWAFESQFSKMGIEKAPVKVRETFADPLRVTEDMTRLDSLLKYMFDLMLHIAERDGAAGKSGNRLAQSVLFVGGENIPHVMTPHFQKKEVSVDQVWKAAWERKVNNTQQLRVAHSVSMGKGYKPNAFDFTSSDGTTMTQADRLAKQMAAAMAKSHKPKKDKLATATAPKEPKAKKVDSKVADAFATLALDSNLMAAFASLTPKK